MNSDIPPRPTEPERVPIAPALGEPPLPLRPPDTTAWASPRVLLLALWAVPIGVALAFVAIWFVKLINFLTNLSFYGKLSFAPASPAGNHLGAWVMVVPLIGAIIVGFLARYGAKAIRGHGIPEAMEQILLNQSRIPPILLFLKPISAAFAIGTGGPFGAEGPIIATGGSLGSIIGQTLKISAAERKTLLACGAAAGMTAIFGTPISATLLAVELLLFELRPRSIIPVSIACVTAMASRTMFFGSGPVFPVPAFAYPSGSAVTMYLIVGALVGLSSVWITRALYVLEDAYERLPVHWMWWPAIGSIVVGVIGYFVPNTLGVGYDNIVKILSGDLVWKALLVLMVFKLISWSVCLASGTSGGTLAPLFIIGGSMGGLIGHGIASLWPSLGVDPRMAAVVGMAAMFAGASRAFLASVVFAFEVTRQPYSLVPLLAGGTAAYLVSWLLMRNTIMTEKIARRGVRVPSELAAEFLDQVHVRDVALKNVVALDATDTVAEVREWLASRAAESLHQGFPVVDGKGRLVGVLTRRDFMDFTVDDQRPVSALVKRAPVVIYDDNTLKEARDHMVVAGVGRLPVLSRLNPNKVVGILSRSDVLSAHRRQIEEEAISTEPSANLRIIRFWRSAEGSRPA